MVLDVQITEQEFLTAVRSAAKPAARTFAIVGALLIAAVLIAWLASANPIVVISILVGGSAGAWIGHTIQVKYMAKRIFRQQKALHRAYHVSWDDEAVTVKSDDGMGLLRWSDLYKAREIEGLFVLFLSDTNFVLIPIRTFPDAATTAEFRRSMEAKVQRSS